MTLSYSNNDSMHDVVSQVVLSLNHAFPEHDIRYNYTPGQSILRIKIADVSDAILDLNLELVTVQTVLHEAIFAIKSLAQHFDS